MQTRYRVGLEFVNSGVPCQRFIDFYRKGNKVKRYGSKCLPKSLELDIRHKYPYLICKHEASGYELPAIFKFDI